MVLKIVNKCCIDFFFLKVKIKIKYFVLIILIVIIFKIFFILLVNFCYLGG